MQLVRKFHSKKNDEFVITAPTAEAACSLMRVEADVDPVDILNEARERKDHEMVYRILSETWYWMPESVEVRREPGFYTLCEILDGEYND